MYIIWVLFSILLIETNKKIWSFRGLSIKNNNYIIIVIYLFYTINSINKLFLLLLIANKNKLLTLGIITIMGDRWCFKFFVNSTRVTRDTQLSSKSIVFKPLTTILSLWTAAPIKAHYEQKYIIIKKKKIKCKLLNIYKTINCLILYGLV